MINRAVTRRLPLALVAALACASGALAADAPSAPPPPGLGAGIIAPGVSVGGVGVSGLSRATARAKVLAERVAPRRRPLVVTFQGRRIGLDPVALGYRAAVDYALRGALLYGRAKPLPARPVNVPLRESVSPARIRAALAGRAARLAVPPRDAAVSLVGGVPKVRAATVGWSLDRPRAERVVRAALLARRFPAYALPSIRLVPEVRSIGPVVVITRDEFKLRVFRGGKRVRSYPVAVGQSAYPTPGGSFRVVEKQVDPTWFPPSSPWAAGLGPVPPGPGNPLGTRWMGTSAPGIGIHGTPDGGSIGTRASHGCIRMYVHDAEDLYRRIEVGAPVYIV